VQQRWTARRPERALPRRSHSAPARGSPKLPVAKAKSQERGLILRGGRLAAGPSRRGDIVDRGRNRRHSLRDRLDHGGGDLLGRRHHGSGDARDRRGHGLGHLIDRLRDRRNHLLDVLGDRRCGLDRLPDRGGGLAGRSRCGG
jgi:hypothetical protein